MKKHFILTGIVALGISSVLPGYNKKDTACDTRPVPVLENPSITGLWELHSGSNGQGKSEVYPDCSGNRLLFTTDGHYYKYSNWKEVQKGTFTLYTDSIYTQHSRGTRIIIDIDTLSPRTFISISSQSLSFFIDAADGPGTSYTRRREN